MDGIVGIYGPGDPELVNKTFLATGACQHRGKASTGLAVPAQNLPRGYCYSQPGIGLGSFGRYCRGAEKKPFSGSDQTSSMGRQLSH